MANQTETLTYAAAIAHPAGRVLDAQVEERVFGWKRWGACGDIYWCPPGKCRNDDQRDLPRYSTDDAAAVSIIRRMAALGWRWCVHDSDSYQADAEMAAQEPFYCYFQKLMPDGGVAEPEAAGETFAQAVARAALGAFCDMPEANIGDVF